MASKVEGVQGAPNVGDSRPSEVLATAVSPDVPLVSVNPSWACWDGYGSR